MNVCIDLFLVNCQVQDAATLPTAVKKDGACIHKLNKTSNKSTPIDELKLGEWISALPHDRLKKTMERQLTNARIVPEFCKGESQINLQSLLYTDLMVWNET